MSDNTSVSAAPSTPQANPIPTPTPQGDSKSIQFDTSSVQGDIASNRSQLASPSKASPTANFDSSSVKLTPEKGKEEEGGEEEDVEEGAGEPPRFNDVEKSLLSTGFKSFMKKKLPDVITVEDAITVFRGSQFVFCGDDVRKLNKEMNGGKPTMDEEMFFKIISKVHCATEEEMQASFDVVELDEKNKELVDVPKLRTLLLSDGERLDIDEWDRFNLEIIPPPPENKKKKKKKMTVKKKLKKGEVEKPLPPPKVPESYFREIMPTLVVEVKLPEGFEEHMNRKKKKKSKKTGGKKKSKK